MQQINFYCRSYCLLNMFRAPLCPSSGAIEYYASGCCLSYLVLGFQVVGTVWRWGLCVRFASSPLRNNTEEHSPCLLSTLYDAFGWNNKGIHFSEIHGVGEAKISDFRIQWGLRVWILTETCVTQSQYINWLRESEYIIVNITIIYLLCLYVVLFFIWDA
jgi:uncharacterized membrane protein